MNHEMIAGILATGIPLFAVGYLMLRKNAGIFRMFTAMLLFALGYLTLTGAINDIGSSVLPAHERDLSSIRRPITGENIVNDLRRFAAEG